MFRRLVLAAGMVLSLVSCSKNAGPPQPVDKTADTTAVALRFNAAAELNPGVTGESTPVRVRIYELKNAAGFLRTDYFALADRAQAALGPDLVDQDEVLLHPGQRTHIERALSPATRHVGLVVGYREIDQAQWRTVLTVSAQKTAEFQVDLRARAVSVAPLTQPAQ
ncbi:type VI secretion system lipoprotein TssJ [Pseudomonas sp. NPDC090203]|uniref:type VI secretion system lipoprotein TssJ n=1 Tax=Pseudomonas sp. NPDC090203 TaxID=3364477 RepID=UPI0038185331